MGLFSIFNRTKESIDREIASLQADIVRSQARIETVKANASGKGPYEKKIAQQNIAGIKFNIAEKKAKIARLKAERKHAK